MIGSCEVVNNKMIGSCEVIDNKMIGWCEVGNKMIGWEKCLDNHSTVQTVRSHMYIGIIDSTYEYQLTLTNN